MSGDTAVVRRPSGVRKYQNHSCWHRIYQWLLTRKLHSVGHGVYVDYNVQFQRHPERISLGQRTVVKEGSRICPTNPDARILVGDWTTIGHHTFIFATTEIFIGNNCLVAPFCYFVDSNHGVRKDRLIREQDMSAKRIVVGDDVWIGTNSVVLKGVSIGSGAVIAAGSIISEDIPEYAIVAGNPAAVVNFRQENWRG